MIYCDFTQYLALGGTMSEDSWTIWSNRASRAIDRLTYGRAKLHTETLSEELADACAQIGDVLSRRQQVTAQGLGLASASNDGISESYLAGGTAVSAVDALIQQILSEALGDDPYGLLYAGVM